MGGGGGEGKACCLLDNLAIIIGYIPSKFSKSKSEINLTL